MRKNSNNKQIEEIKKVLKKHKEELIRKYGVREIGIFGSWIKGKQKSDSDIDILVEFEKPIDFFEFLELEEELENLLAVNVDLVMKKSLKPNIGRYILSEVVYV